MKKTNRRKTIVPIIITIIILIFLFSIIFAIINIGNSKILNGITISGIDVSGMTKDEAIKQLTEITQNKISSTISVNYDEEESTQDTTIDLATIETEYDINSAVNEAYNIGRTGNIFQNNYEILNLLINNKNIEINISINEDKLSNIIKNISSNLQDKLTNSSYYIEDDNLIITRGEAGNTIKEDEFKEEIYDIVHDLTKTEEYIDLPIEYKEPDEINIDEIHNEVYKEAQNAYYEQNPFKVYNEVQGVDFDIDYAKSLIQENPEKKEYKIPLKYTDAEVTLEDLDVDIFPDLLGNYSTKYNELDEDRTNNLKLAASKIDGTILSPGEEFSYNKIVGERSIAAGYKESKIYSQGKVIDGLGGGICQISSTLYNAVMFANLEITERHNHQFITSYSEPGRDATVAYGSKDLKFVNNRTYPIKINVIVESGIAKVQIYGIKEEIECTVEFEIETVSTTDFDVIYEDNSSMQEGTEKVKQAGANGIVVNSYKVTKQNGIVVSKELISQDTYKKLDKVIERGTKKNP